MSKREVIFKFLLDIVIPFLDLEYSLKINLFLISLSLLKIFASNLE